MLARPDSSGSGTGAGSSLRDYLAVLRRQKVIVLAAMVLVPAAAIGYSITQQHLYQAQAQVLLKSQNLATLLANVNAGALSGSLSDRVTKTQATLAQTPEVAQRALKQVGLHKMTPGQFLGASGVSASTNSDVLTFSVTDRNPKVAGKLATAYAEAYIAYRQQLDTAALRRAQGGLESRIAKLTKSGRTRSALYANLVGKDQQLHTMEALQTANALLIRDAGNGSQVQPRPFRNALLGVVLGMVLGIGLAFLREALDTRVRSAEEIGERLQIPLLARIPKPARGLEGSEHLVMTETPSSPQAEPFRVLRTNFEFVNVDQGMKTVMVTSALQAEGKSTTSANLAISLALAGREVILVDLDFRKPYQHKFFSLESGPGLTDVALGHASLDDALIRVALAKGPKGESSGNGSGTVMGTLSVVGTGAVPPNPGEFIGSRAIGNVLDDLKERADIVIIDTAPLLGVGDTLALSKSVDAVLIVTKVNRLRRGTLSELHRILESFPSARLGFVLAGAEEETSYGYGGYGYGYGYGYGQYAYGYGTDEPKRRRFKVGIGRR